MTLKTISTVSQIDVAVANGVRYGRSTFGSLRRRTARAGKIPM